MQRVVVFKEPIEFERLKRLFYGSYEDQQRALALAKAYQVRGHLPASIHLTALVVAARHNDVPQNDLYAIRQTYAMAIIRLVNEILDSAQIGRVAAPLHALARDLKLPSSFVELRHAATHEEMPTIYLLRDMSLRAMDWLWDAYWSKNRPKRAPDADSEPPTPTSSESPAPDSVKDLFRAWRRLRRKDVSADIDSASAQIIAEIAAAPADVVVDVALNRNILLPTATSASVVIPLWGPLLVALGPTITDMIFAQLVASRNKSDWPALETTPTDAALDSWLNYLIEHTTDAVHILSELPRPWNATLLAKIANSQGSAQVYAVAEEMAAVTGASLAPFSGTKLDVKDYSPWKKTPNWTPRPLGCIDPC